MISTAGNTLTATLEKAAEDFLATRKFSRETLGKLPVARGTKFFPDVGQNQPAIIFNYAEGWKARSLEGKHFVAGKGFKLSFWNLQKVLAGPLDTVYLVEGECDAAALVEAGISETQVLSVPNGAKEHASDDTKEYRGYDYVYDALDAGLKKAKKFVWCGDNDAPGLALRSDMVRILGASRFWFVGWPEGCKDANDYLISDGKQALFELVTDGALQWPVDGIYRLSELPEPPKLETWNIGLGAGDRILFAPRTMQVTTGTPGSGKTLLMNQAYFHICKEHDLIQAMFTAETQAKPHVRRQIRTLYSGFLERDMSDESKRKADEWMNEHYLFLQHPQDTPTLEWLLDMAEVAVIRHGAKIIRVDPWNRLEGQHAKDESKTDYIGRCLKTIHSFAKDMNVHFQIIAHPSKMEGNRRGQPPLLEDISDSAHWFNMVDQGLVVHRPKRFDGGVRVTTAELYHRKARFDALGYDCKIDLNFDLEKGRYVSLEAPIQ